MVEAEKPGQNIEKLLMERVMLRKELRLRSVQVKIIYLYICWCVCPFIHVYHDALHNTKDKSKLCKAQSRERGAFGATNA